MPLPIAVRLRYDLTMAIRKGRLKAGVSECALIALVALGYVGCRPAPGSSGEEGSAAPSPAITAAEMRSRISYLASDRLGGRGTPSQGLEAAADYVRAEFVRFGLEAPRGGFIQRYRLGGGPRAATAPNVIAVLKGSDPRLQNEYVLISAHMDGLGVGQPVDGDSIYNGADDNASGTAAILEVAEGLALAEERPRRSIAFLAVSGEERGLLGSSWFVENPPMPLERIVANVNIDMVGRNWEDTIAVIGKPYSTLGVLVDSVAAANPQLRLAAVGDLWPSEGFFFRSDHFNFARKGIPSIFLFNGVHEDYHRPSDEVGKIKFDKAARIARLVFEVSLALANLDEPPRWEPRARDLVVEEGR